MPRDLILWGVAVFALPGIVAAVAAFVAWLGRRGER